MKTAIFPGSFNPWHEGHQEVLNKALQIFDKVIIAQGYNPEKCPPITLESIFNSSQISYRQYSGLLVDFINRQPELINAVIKGLRNSQDLEYEKIQQYWNEDLGINIPTFYIISDRNLTHISSSAIRATEQFK